MTHCAAQSTTRSSTKLYITETDAIDGEAGEPFDILFNLEVQSTALRRKQADGGQSRDQTANVPGLNKDQPVHLAGWFSNPRKPLVTLIRRVLRGSRRSASRPERQPIEDVRGSVAKNSPRSQTRLSVSNRAALAEEYAKGVPVDELVRRFGIHRTTVHRLASQVGVAMRRRGLDEPGRREAARLYEQGMTLEEVAAELGVGHETVRSAVVAGGGTIRPRGRRPARV